MNLSSVNTVDIVAIFYFFLSCKEESKSKRNFQNISHADTAIPDPGFLQYGTYLEPDPGLATKNLKRRIR